MEFLANYYTAAPINKLYLLLASWLFWPGSMFIVGAIFESRLVPIVHHQSRAFMPGDLALEVAFVALVGVEAHSTKIVNWAYSMLWWWFVLIVVALIAWQVHLGDIVNYPPRAAASPTKLLHNFVGFFLIPVVLAGLGIPRLVSSILHGGQHGCWICWIVFALALIFYGACLMLDVRRGFTAEDLATMHPANWKPLWR